MCALQKTRWKEGSSRIITGKNNKYKFIWSGDDSDLGGVGFLVAENWIEKIILVDRTSRHMALRIIIIIIIIIGRKIIEISSSYAPQSGLPEPEKDKFYFNLLGHISSVPAKETLIVCGDLNGQVGKDAVSFEGVHGGHGYGERNPEGTRILELCTAADLVLTNTHFTKKDSRIITYRSGNSSPKLIMFL